MGVHAPDAKLLGMATNVSGNDEGTEVALRIEVLDVCGLDRLDGVSVEAASLADAEKAGFRSAMTVFGQVVYAASGLTTQNPVRLGGLPHGTDLAIAVLPPASAPSADAPLLATAPLAIGMMRACGKPVSPQEGWPAGALIWEGWLPLSLCSKEGSGLTEGSSGDARIRVSVLLEEPEQLSLDVTHMVPRASDPQPTVSSLGSCLSSPMRSDDISEATPTPHIEKAQSFRLEKPSMSEVSNEAQPARPAFSLPRSSHLASSPPETVYLSQETTSINPTPEILGDTVQVISQAPTKLMASTSLPEGPAVSLSPARAAPEPAAGIRSVAEGPRVQPASGGSLAATVGPLAASVPVALSVMAPSAAATRSAPSAVAAGPGSPTPASPGRQHRGSGGSAASSVSAGRVTVLSEQAVPAERSAVASTAEISSTGSSAGGSVAGAAPSLREAELQMENSRLRSELESSRQELASLHHRREEDHQHVQEKLRELEIEVRSRWQKRVSELEAEVATLKQSLVAASGSASVNASVLSADMDVHNISQVQQTATVAAYPSAAYLPIVGGVGRCGGGPAGHHSATLTPPLQWPEFGDPSIEGPLLEGPRLGPPSRDSVLQTPVRISSPSGGLGRSPTVGSAPSLGSPEPSWPKPQLGASMAPFPAASLQSPSSGGMMPSSMSREFHGNGQRVCLDSAAAAAAHMTAPGGLLPPPGLKVQGLGPVNLQQIDFLERNPVPRYPENADDSVSDSAWPAPSGQASMSAMCGGMANSPAGGMMTTPAKRRDSRPPSPPRPSLPPPPSRPSPTMKVQALREEITAIPVSVESASSSLCTVPATARASSPEWREQDIRSINLRNDPSVVLKNRSQSVPIMARPSIPKGQADEKGLLGFFEAFGGLYTQLVQGTKCTGPDALAVNERLVEIDLSAEFPPERRAAQVDLVAQALNSKTRM